MDTVTDADIYSEVACTLWELQPLSFYGKNMILHLLTGLFLSLILQSITMYIAYLLNFVL